MYICHCLQTKQPFKFIKPIYLGTNVASRQSLGYKYTVLDLPTLIGADRFLTKNAAISALLCLLCLLKYLEYFNGFEPCSFYTQIACCYVRKLDIHVPIA